MADLSITAANVDRTSGNVRCDKDAGETITAGQAVYLDATTEKWLLADADNEIESTEDIGIALSDGRLNQPLPVQTNGILNLGATLAKGVIYVISAGPGTGSAVGGIAPYDDLVSGDYVYVLGQATSTSSFTLRIWNTTTTLA